MCRSESFCLLAADTVVVLAREIPSTRDSVETAH